MFEEDIDLRFELKLNKQGILKLLEKAGYKFPVSIDNISVRAESKKQPSIGFSTDHKQHLVIEIIDGGL